MNFRHALALLTLAAALPAFASGASSPQPEPAPAPAPAPEPEPAPVDPTLGTRYATLRDLFEQATVVPTTADYLSWDEYKATTAHAYNCVQIAKDYPNTLDYDVVVLRMNAGLHNSGPAFPGDRNDRLAFARYSVLLGQNYSNWSVVNEMWDATEVSALSNQLQVTYGGSNVYDVRKNGNLTVWHFHDSWNESMGYCFPPNTVNVVR